MPLPGQSLAAKCLASMAPKIPSFSGRDLRRRELTYETAEGGVANDEQAFVDKDEAISALWGKPPPPGRREARLRWLAPLQSVLCGMVASPACDAAKCTCIRNKTRANRHGREVTGKEVKPKEGGKKRLPPLRTREVRPPRLPSCATSDARVQTCGTVERMPLPIVRGAIIK